jgi:uncharacterized membrane protein
MVKGLSSQEGAKRLKTAAYNELPMARTKQVMKEPMFILLLAVLALQAVFSLAYPGIRHFSVSMIVALLLLVILKLAKSSVGCRVLKKQEFCLTKNTICLSSLLSYCSCMSLSGRKRRIPPFGRGTSGH